MRELTQALGALRHTGELALSARAALPAMSVLVFDGERRFASAAGEALAAHGHSREAIEGRTLSEVLPGEFVGRFEPYYRAALRGQSSAFVHESSTAVAFTTCR
jgi:hypothetical protein